MKLISGLTEQPKQQSTLVLADGTRAVWSLSYKPQQTGWFYDITWNDAVIATGQRLVSSPNILRQYINRVSFGIAVVSPNQIEPTTQTAFTDGTATCYLLEGSDLSDVETKLFGAPAGQVQPVNALVTPPTPILPSEWGPAGGDLGGAYPNPSVLAITEPSGPTQLVVAPVADGQYLKRSGNTLVGGNPAGTGNVVGPGSAVDGHLTVFDGVTGKLIKDGGAVPTALPPNGAAGGDFTGTYPNPILVAIGAATGPVGDSTHVAQITVDAKGRVTALASVAIAALGVGNVVGPASSVDGGVALFDGATGKLLKDGTKSPTLDNLTLVGGLAASIVQGDVFRYPLSFAPGGGAFSVDMSSTNTQFFDLSITNLSLTLANIAVGEQVLLIIRNSSGGTATINYPAWSQTGNLPPLKLAPGRTIQIKLIATGTTTASVFASSVVPDTFNVRDFGAVGNGSTDDTSAFNAAFAAINAVGGRGAITVPPGNYRLTSQLNWTLASNTLGFSMIGSGRGSSILLWTNTSGASGINLTLVYPQQAGITNQSPVLFRGLGFAPAQASAGTGLYIAGATSDRGADTATVEDCGFYTYYNGAAYQSWTDGICFDSCLTNIVRNCLITSNNGTVGSGVKIAYTLTNPPGSPAGGIPSPLICSDTPVLGFSKAIDLGSPSQFSIQGVFLTNVTAVGSQYLVYCGQTTGSNVGDGLQMTNCYAAATVSSVYLRNFVRVQIVNLFSDGYDAPSSGKTHIDIDGSKHVVISDSVFNGQDGSAVGTGISLANLHGAQIHHNIFINLTTDAKLASTVNLCLFDDNIFEDASGGGRAGVVSPNAPTNSRVVTTFP
jgi:hypothetical protein